MKKNQSGKRVKSSLLHVVDNFCLVQRYTKVPQRNYINCAEVKNCYSVAFRLTIEGYEFTFLLTKPDLKHIATPKQQKFEFHVLLIFEKFHFVQSN